MSYFSEQSHIDYKGGSEYSDSDVIEFGVFVINSSKKRKQQPYGTLIFQPYEGITYRKLIMKLNQSFPFLRDENYYLTCIDEYGYTQDIIDDEDLEIVIQEFCDERNLYVLYNDEISESSGGSCPSQYYCNFCCFALEYSRYKCTECPEYDLCTTCFKDGIHNEHEMEYLEIVSFSTSNLKVREIDYCDLQAKRHIGAGTFGDVYSALDQRTNNRVAVKFFKDLDGKEKSFLREVQIFKKLKEHENVVKIFGYCAPTSETNMGIVMECITMKIDDKEISGLNKYLLHLRKLFLSLSPVDHRELDSFALQIARGMEYLEANDIVHRDLATRNVLIDCGKNIKISDFGLLEIDDYYKGDYSIFGARWAAPEVIKYEEYSNKSDVWAFGVVLWEIATLGGLPYSWLDSDEAKRFVANNGRLNKPKNVSHRMFEIMIRCWTKKPKNRPDFQELVDKLLDFKWMSSAYFDFEDLDDDFELPYAWEEPNLDYF